MASWALDYSCFYSTGLSSSWLEPKWKLSFVLFFQIKNLRVNLTEIYFWLSEIIQRFYFHFDLLSLKFTQSARSNSFTNYDFCTSSFISVNIFKIIFIYNFS